MEKTSTARYEAKSAIIKAMAHPTRLLIIQELSKKEHCVCELTEMAGADTSTVSRHLSILKNAGIVTFEKRGQMIYYNLAMPCVLNFMSCLDSALQEKARAQMELVS